MARTIGSVYLLITIWMVGSAEIPSIKLNDGGAMPAIALGTYLGFDQNGIVKPVNKVLRDAVLRALEDGYRHFDTASIYGTEEELGEAVNMKIDSCDLRREEVFITTKLWNTQHRREQVPLALRESLKKLDLNYVDLYLMHWPIGLNEDYTYSDVDYMETWRGLEDCKRLGLARSIGVSNFNKEQLDRLMKEGTEKPAVLEIEVHLQNTQEELVGAAQGYGVTVMAYSPFGSLVKRYGQQQPGPSADDPALAQIASKYNKTVQQVALRWLVDRNIVPIPKSVHPKRIEQNINIFDFKLTDEEKKTVSSYNENKRYTLPSFWQDHIYYPFEKVENPLQNPFVNVMS